MAYIDPQSGQYPLTEAQLRAAYPDCSLGADFVAACLVETAIPPSPAAGQIVVEDAPVQVDGAWVQAWTVRDASEAESAAALERAGRAINRIRDQRIEGGFTYDGHLYQSRQSDRENIIRKGDRADRAIADGCQAGDYLWDATTDGHPFVWIDADNNLVPLDAQHMAALRDAGETFKQATTFYARWLKDQIAAGQSPDIETGWPE